MFYEKQNLDIKLSKMNKFIFDVKQLKINKLIQSIWQLTISTSDVTLEVPLLRLSSIFCYFFFVFFSFVPDID